MIIRQLWLRASLVIVLGWSGCTDSTLYSLQGLGANLPDRVSFEGTVCAPAPIGRNFPTRLLFTLQGGEDVGAPNRAVVADAVTQLVNQYSSRTLRFGLVGFHQLAHSMVSGGFDDSVGLTSGLAQYQGFGESGALYIYTALSLSESLVSGIMLQDCKGARARGRYTVLLVFFGPDSTPDSYCQSDVFSESDVCHNASPCSLCLIKQQVQRIRALGDKYNVGQVTVQPIYVPLATPNAAAREQMRLIAEEGGTEAREADLSHLADVLASLNVVGMESPFTLKTTLAFNRNAHIRAGKVIVDSDGDNLTDDEEIALGTDPLNPDSDGDGLMDGVEILSGMNPLAPDTINGCDPGVDNDLDGLNSCEERLLGTEDCMGDTDGDGVPDLVEFFAGTNSLKDEQTDDTDHDGFGNIDELRRHTDPMSVDVQFVGDHSYTYQFSEQPPPVTGSAEAATDPCPGQARYQVQIGNVGLVSTQATLEHEAGINDIYLYMVFGASNGGSIARWQTQQIKFTPPNKRDPPASVIELDEEVYELRP